MSQVLRALRVQPARLDHRVSKDRPELRVQLARPGYRATPGRKVRLEPQEHKACLAILVRRARPDPKAPRGQRDLRARLVQPRALALHRPLLQLMDSSGGQVILATCLSGTMTGPVVSG